MFIHYLPVNVIVCSRILSMYPSNTHSWTWPQVVSPMLSSQQATQDLGFWHGDITLFVFSWNIFVMLHIVKINFITYGLRFFSKTYR